MIALFKVFLEVRGDIRRSAYICSDVRLSVILYYKDIKKSDNFRENKTLSDFIPFSLTDISNHRLYLLKNGALNSEQLYSSFSAIKK